MVQDGISLKERGEALRGRSIETKCAQAHCTLIHSLGSQLILRLWLPEESELGVGKCCPLVDIFYNYNLNAGAYWHLQFTRRKGLLMIAAIRKRPTVGIADINSNTTDFQEANCDR